MFSFTIPTTAQPSLVRDAMTITEWLSVENTLFRVSDYPLSLLEILSVVLSFWGYCEIIRGRIRGLVIGVFSTLLMAVLFKQIKLYSDMLLMLYYSGASLVAIYMWYRSRSAASGMNITRLSPLGRLQCAGLIVALTIMFSMFSGNLHHLFPEWFREAAVYPWQDAFTTSLCIAGSILLIRKKLECMFLWTVANLISVVLYFKLGVLFLAMLYILYTAVDLVGLILWTRWANRKARCC